MKLRRILFIGSIVMSAIITLLLSNKKGDAWEEHVRNGLYAFTSDSIPDYDYSTANSLDLKKN